MNLNLQLSELLGILGEGTVTQDPSFHIQRVTSLEQAGPHDLAIVFDRGDQSVFDGIAQKVIQDSQAGLLLAATPIVEGKQYLLVKDPLQSFSRLFAHIQKVSCVVRVASSAVIDTTACVDTSVIVEDHVVIARNAKIGCNTIVKAGSFIGSGVVIGDNVIIYPGVKILDFCVVGDHSIIHAGSVIGSDGFGYQVTATGLRKIPQIGIVKIGKHVEIGANCSFDRASFSETIIEDYVKIDNGVHIAHNVVIGMGTAILAQTGIAGSAKIGRACQIGGQVAIKDNVRIGNNVKIVSKSGVIVWNDLADGEVVAGIPARSFSQWKRTMVVFSKLPELAKSVKELATIAQQMSNKESVLKKIAKFFSFLK